MPDTLPVFSYVTLPCGGSHTLPVGREHSRSGSDCLGLTTSWQMKPELLLRTPVLHGTESSTLVPSL